MHYSYRLYGKVQILYISYRLLAKHKYHTLTQWMWSEIIEILQKYSLYGYTIEISFNCSPSWIQAKHILFHLGGSLQAGFLDTELQHSPAGFLTTINKNFRRGKGHKTAACPITWSKDNLPGKTWQRFYHCHAQLLGLGKCNSRYIKILKNIHV